jgi:hypothetical protein
MNPCYVFITDIIKKLKEEESNTTKMLYNILLERKLTRPSVEDYADPSDEEEYSQMSLAKSDDMQSSKSNLMHSTSRLDAEGNGLLKPFASIGSIPQRRVDSLVSLEQFESHLQRKLSVDMRDDSLVGVSAVSLENVIHGLEMADNRTYSNFSRSHNINDRTCRSCNYTNSNDISDINSNSNNRIALSLESMSASSGTHTCTIKSMKNIKQGPLHTSLKSAVGHESKVGVIYIYIYIYYAKYNYAFYIALNLIYYILFTPKKMLLLCKMSWISSFFNYLIYIYSGRVINVIVEQSKREL